MVRLRQLGALWKTPTTPAPILRVRPDKAERIGPDRAEPARLRGDSVLLGACFDPSFERVRTGPTAGGVAVRLSRRLYRSARGMVRRGEGGGRCTMCQPKQLDRRGRQLLHQFIIKLEIKGAERGARSF